MSTDAARYHDQRAEEFVRQYGNDPDFKERLNVWKSFLAEFARAGQDAVDLGCGAGTVSFLLADLGLRVLGVDGSPEMIRLCNERNAKRPGRQVTFRQANLPTDLPSSGFDVVTASSVLEYLDDTEATDRWLTSLVRPGGFLLLSLPNRESLQRHFETALFRVSGWPPYRAHVRRIADASTTIRRFETLGLKAVAVRYYAHRAAFVSRFTHGWLPSRLTKNLFALVLKKPA